MLSENVLTNPSALQDILNNPQQLETLFPSSTPSESIKPIPSFTIKAFQKSKKVFINISHSPLIPAPANRNPTLNSKIPLSLQGPTKSLDKKGKECKVFSCCFHSSVINHCSDTKYKDFIIELALQWVCEKSKIELENVSLPKLKHFGPIVDHIVKKRLVEEQGYWIKDGVINFDLSGWTGGADGIEIWEKDRTLCVEVKGLYSFKVEGVWGEVREGVYNVGSRILSVEFSTISLN